MDMDIKPHILEMENGVLSQGSAECFNNIPIKREAQHQNCEHPFSADELNAKVKIENLTEASVTHLVKTELVEFHNNASNENSHQNQKDTLTFMLDEIMKTETKIVDVDVDLSYTCEEGGDSNSDSDHERDPFADVDCDPIFSQRPQTYDSSASATHRGSINSPNTFEGSIKSSYPKSNLSTARILKRNIRRKTGHLDYALQCNLCLVTLGSEQELEIHLEMCAPSHIHGNRFCVLCNKLYSTHHVYKKHAVQVHTSSSIQCGLCFEKFFSKSELKPHLEICAPSHANSRRFCVPCNKSFGTVDVLKKHAFRIHGIVSEGSTLSSFPKTNLSTPRILKRKRIYKRKPPPIDYTFQCHLCQVTHSSKRELESHLDACATSGRHGNRFCVLCNKLFATPYAKNLHASRKHGISSSIQCGLCLEQFSSDSELTSHLEICAASHSNSRRFCVPCNKLLCSVNSFQVHSLSKHGIARVK